MRKLLSFLLALAGLAIVCPRAKAQSGASLEKVIQSVTGQPLAGITVTVCHHHSPVPNPCTDVATIYSDVELTNPIANPTKTDGLGNLSVFVAAGAYDYTVSGGNTITHTYTTTTNDQVGPTGPTGPTGPAGSVTSNSGMTVGGSAVIKGPDPLYDIAAYGARSFDLNNAANWQFTANCFASSTAITGLTNAANFVNGDGISIYGCGPTPTLGTPSAPTVVSGNSKDVMVPNAAIRSRTGSNTYNYKIVAEDKLGAYSPAGSATILTTAVTLGMQSMSLTSESLTGSTLSIVVGTSGVLGTGDVIDIQGGGDPGLGGVYVISSGSGTSFTINNIPVTAVNGATKTSTGGTLYYWSGNQVSWSAATGAFKYLICGERPGDVSYHLLGASWPTTGSGAEQNNLVWTDWGSTITTAGTYVPPWLFGGSQDGVCSNASLTNDPLTTTIVSGGGTSSIVVANAASQNATGAGQLDAVPGLQAAINASCNSLAQGSVYIPPATAGAQPVFPISSYIDIRSMCSGGGTKVSIVQNGNIAVYQTIVVPAKWTGRWSSGQRLNEAWGGGPNVDGAGAYPVMMANFNDAIEIDHINVVSTYANQYLNFLWDGTNTSFYGLMDHVNFGTFQASGDYLGIGLGINQGVSYTLNNVAFATGDPGTNSHNTMAPTLVSYTYLSATVDTLERGIYAVGGFLSNYNQGCTTPAVVVNDSPNPGGIGNIVGSSTCDSSPMPAFVALISPGFVNVTGTQAAEAAGYQPLLSGKAPTETTGNVVNDPQSTAASPFPPRLGISPNSSYVYSNVNNTSPLACVLGSAPTAAAGISNFWCDSGTGRWMMNNNAAGATPVTGQSDFGSLGYGPGLVAEVNLTTQAADISSTALYSVPFALRGVYRASCVITITQVATMSSTVPGCTVGWTNQETQTTESSSITLSSTANTLGSPSPSAGIIINAGGITHTESFGGYSNGALPGSWTTVTGFSGPQVSSGNVVNSGGAGSNVAAYYNAVTLNGNLASTAVYSGSSFGIFGAILTDGANGYVCGSNDGTHINLRKFAGTTFSGIGGSIYIGRGFMSGDVVTITETSPGNYECSLNGSVLVTPQADATYTVTKAGIYLNGDTSISGSNQDAISSWTGADVPTINYLTSGYASSGATPMQFSLHFRLEYLGQ